MSHFIEGALAGAGGLLLAAGVAGRAALEGIESDAAGVAWRRSLVTGAGLFLLGVGLFLLA